MTATINGVVVTGTPKEIFDLMQLTNVTITTFPSAGSSVIYYDDYK